MYRNSREIIKNTIVNVDSLESLNKQLTTSNALNVLQKRYLRTDSNGIMESPYDMFKRVAKVISDVDSEILSSDELENEYRYFLELMSTYKFLPNSPTLMNAGNGMNLSACFVLGLEDSMEGIFETVKQSAIVSKSGGGCGFSFSKLRPRNDIVRSTMGVSSGPVDFMKVFDATCEVVKQGSKRRGALMGILRCDHPDILEFIDCKQDKGKLNNFNISVMLTDKFMDAVYNNNMFELINPRNGEIGGEVNAKETFDKIIHNAYTTGEPGIIFYDKVNKYNRDHGLELVEALNPCGESSLTSYESCNLASINLSKFVYTDSYDGKIKIDWNNLSDTVHMGIRFLDNVVSANHFPIPEIKEKTLLTRKLGLGVMGWADMLVLLKIRYDSNDAIKIAHKVMGFIEREAVAESEWLAEEKGSFPIYNSTSFDKPRRNATVTCIAPTGTLSIIADCSSGIEPYYALEFTKNVMNGEKLVEYNKYIKIELDKHGIDDINKLWSLPNIFKDIYRTAHDISWKWHIDMQSAFQKHVEMNISKTINMHHDATEEDVRNAYLYAYKNSECKGITVYRDGSREGQVLTVDKKKEKEDSIVNRIESKIVPRVRPITTHGSTSKIKTGCGSLYVTVNHDDNGICEVFCTMGRSGGCTSSQSEALSRLISLALRSGVQPNDIIRQLKGIRCPNPCWGPGKDGTVLSCADGIGKVLRNSSGILEVENGQEYDRCISSLDSINNNSNSNSMEDIVDNINDKDVPIPIHFEMAGECPECGGILIAGDGCAVCNSCGYSKCG